MALCNQCGKEMPEDAVFCTNCGAPAMQGNVTEAAVSPAQYAPAPPVYGAQPVYGAPPAYAPAPYGMQPLYRPHNAGARNITFFNSFLGITLLGVLFIASLLTGVITVPIFFDPRNLDNMFMNFCLLGAVAFAVTVSTRAKGPDLSIGSLMGLTAMFIALNSTTFDSPVIAVLVAIAICAAIGLINGVLITCLRIPAVIVTLLTGVMAHYAVVILADGRVMEAPEALLSLRSPFGAAALLFITLAIAFLIIFFTKLGKPMYKRDKKGAVSYVLAYAVSAVIASLSGVFLLSRLTAASPTLGTGYETFILFVFACAISSRALDNRIAPAFYAAAPALSFAVLSNVLMINGIDGYVQSIIRGGIALIFIIIAFIVRPKPESSGAGQNVNMPV